MSPHQLTYQKQVEKLEVTVHEYSLKIEEMNRTIIDITSHKTRISQVGRNCLKNQITTDSH